MPEPTHQERCSMPEHDGRPHPVAEQYPHAGGWVIVAQGDLDPESLPPLRRAMEKAAAALPVLVLDVQAVTFADTSVLDLLLQLHRATTLRIAAAPPHLLRLVDITATDTALDLYPTVAHACTATTPGQRRESNATDHQLPTATS
ncbi:STAS domain-containing protein [Streptomyces beijiangensis]|uniref:STAS domain-containing protein n=1 Tax=Streptomyces beijiangensis TaxID=163361 RepID=A0A939JFQ5_9ACTN|nr:STAS domain-containing protein [Streptomyces beijiangensis]MBO0510752.1 STAS domain-containing protein [Streptomyces beijiangensis]